MGEFNSDDHYIYYCGKEKGKKRKQWQILFSCAPKSLWMVTAAMKLKDACFLIVVLQKTLENSLDCKEIKPINLEGNQPWIFIGRTHAKAEAPILWPRDVKSLLPGKDPDAGKVWRQKKKGVAEDEIVR